MSGDGWESVEGWRPSKVFIADFVDGELSSDPEKEIDADTRRVEVLVRRDGRAVGMVNWTSTMAGPPWLTNSWSPPLGSRPPWMHPGPDLSRPRGRG